MGLLKRMSSQVRGAVSFANEMKSGVPTGPGAPVMGAGGAGSTPAPIEIIGATPQEEIDRELATGAFPRRGVVDAVHVPASVDADGHTTGGPVFGTVHGVVRARRAAGVLGPGVAFTRRNPRRSIRRRATTIHSSRRPRTARRGSSTSR